MVSLVPSTFNAYGPHRYFERDRHLTSPFDHNCPQQAVIGSGIGEYSGEKKEELGRSMAKLKAKLRGFNQTKDGEALITKLD
ncbi:hypothetical protein [Paenibacillus sp. FSL R10-2771]|uniref:hypothetical protein n=1 Tax=Paenibacillus sp. FSL R10-2771 TaxID=2954693 RepID=UPI0030F8B57C